MARGQKFSRLLPRGAGIFSHGHGSQKETG